MLKEILEKLRKNEVLCDGARTFAKKIKKLSGKVTIKCKEKGSVYTTDSNVSIIGGYISVKDARGEDVELDLCGNTDYEVV